MPTRIARLWKAWREKMPITVKRAHEFFREAPYRAFMPKWGQVVTHLDQWYRDGITKAYGGFSQTFTIYHTPEYRRSCSRTSGVPRWLTVPQAAFFKSTAQERWLVASNRSGKTMISTLDAVLTALGYHPYREASKKPNLIWIGCEDWLNHGRRITKDRIRWALGQRGWKWREQERTFYVDIEWSSEPSPIIIKSYDSGAQKWQGDEPVLVNYDEAPPHSVHLEVGARIGEEPLCISGTFTPLYQTSAWLQREYRDWLRAGRPPRSAFFKADLDSNPYLAPEEKERFKERFKEGSDEYRIRVMGDWTTLGGAVYPNFEEAIHVVEPFQIPGVHREPRCKGESLPDGTVLDYDEVHWTIYRAIDPGIRNETAVLWVAVDPRGHAWVYREIFQSNLSIPQVCKLIHEMQEQREIVQATTIDEAAQQRDYSTGLSRVDAYNTHGVYVLPASNKDILAGVQAVKDGLEWERDEHGYWKREPRIRIFKNCRNLIRELGEISWEPHKRTSEKDPQERPQKKDDHCENALRYLWVKWHGQPPFVPRDPSTLDTLPDSEIYDKTTGYIR